MKKARLVDPQNFPLPASEADRVFASCSGVETLDGILLGHVYKEQTLDVHGRPIKTWWHAQKIGSRVRILCAAGTRQGAVKLLGGILE